jgi:hypothetical protein
MDLGNLQKLIFKFIAYIQYWLPIIKGQNLDLYIYFFIEIKPSTLF